MEATKQAIDPKEARERIAGGDVSVVDVQGDDQFEEARIPGAAHWSPDEVDGMIDDVSTDEPIVVMCEDGKRSAEVAERLRDAGCDATSIRGGMAAWSKEDLPVQPRADIEFEGPGDSLPGT